jgi:uncharacterized protein (DUF2141 family)
LVKDFPMPSLLPLRAGLAVLALMAGAPSVLAAPASPPAPPPDCGGPASATWINVDVAEVRNSNGLIAVTLYADDSSTFLAHHGSLYTGRFPAHQGITHTCIFVPKPGIYAIAAYHDENANRKLDRGETGAPTEGFGFSNNPSTFMGIPAFSRVRLAVPKPNLGTTINLRYPS